MKIFILIFILMFTLEAKIIEVTQLFNKSIIEVKNKNISYKKYFYGETKIDESSIIEINTRFDGFIEKLYANSLYMKIYKKKPLLEVYSNELRVLQEELKLTNKIGTLYEGVIRRFKTLDINKIVLNNIINSDSIIKNIEVYSPIDGYLIEKNVYDRSFIKKGKTLFKIASFDYLWVIVKVYQKDLDFIKEGMNSLILIDGFNNPIKGNIDYIYPIMNTKTKTIDVRIIIDNRNYKLYPNMFVKVFFIKKEKNVLVLPKSAILIKGSKYYVFKPINKREFEPLLIEVKRINSNEFEIIKGLKQGDKVIDQVMFMLDSESITNGLYDNSDSDW